MIHQTLEYLFPKLGDEEMWNEWARLKTEYRGKENVVFCLAGLIDFSHKGMRTIVGGEKLTYDEYLDVQFMSSRTCRKCFRDCYYEGMFIPSFCARVSSLKQGRICFKEVFVSGGYTDGILVGCSFVGKEDHVWMDAKGFENFNPDDIVSFSAEVYRYLKTSNGRLIDFGLRNPKCIALEKEYRLPSDEELLWQSVDELVCNYKCMYREHCYFRRCIMHEGEHEQLRKAVYDQLKAAISARG